MEQYLPLFEQSSQAVFWLHDSSGRRYGPYTFDISSIRRVSEALTSRNWKC